MKKAQLYDTAERLYCEELMTFEQVAKQVGCSDRSVRAWAKEGKWEQKKENIRVSRTTLTDDAREIAVLLGGRIKGLLQDDLEPSPHIINAFTRLAASLINVRKGEPEDTSEAVNEDNKKEAYAKMRELFGNDIL